jgi:hypothetical protein
MKPPGWYDDPYGSSNAERRWDGQGWTPERRRKNTQAPPPPYPQSAPLPPYPQPSYVQPAPPPIMTPPTALHSGTKTRTILVAVGAVVLLLLGVGIVAGARGHSSSWEAGYSAGFRLGAASQSQQDSVCRGLRHSQVVLDSGKLADMDDFIEGCKAAYGH